MKLFVHRALAKTAALLAVSTAAGSAHGDVSAHRLVPLLDRTAAATPNASTPALLHPLAADDGRVPLLVRTLEAQARGLLPVAPGYGAVWLSPAELREFRLTHPDLVPRFAPPRHTMLNYSHTWVRHEEVREETGYDGSGVVVGIIDTGLDTSHPDFRDANGKSRVAWMYLRQPPLGLHPELETTYGCNNPASMCAILSGDDIDALLAQGPDSAPRDLEGHGTHVTSIAAGNGLSTGNDNPAFDGVAPKATLIVASPSAGGGFSDPDILNAARFIYDRAADLGMPAVVNVSLGSDYGPHDGTSDLERGLAQMVGDQLQGRVMVVAAGNSGSLIHIDGDGPYGVHTEVHVSPNATSRVPMKVAGGNGLVTGAGFVWVTFRPTDNVEVGLEGPDGEWIGLVAPGDDAGYQDDEVSAAVINNVADEESSIPVDSNSAVIAWDGRWDSNGEFAVLLRGRGDAQLWVTGTGGAAPGATHGLLFRRGMVAGTVAVPASHPELIAVGCTLNRTGWTPLLVDAVIHLSSFGPSEAVLDSACYFSGAGPTATGLMKPDISAPGGFVTAAMSRDADPRVNPDSIFLQGGCPDEEPCHIVDEFHALNSGTSMSAPHVAGAAALLLQADPTLTQAQMLELLQAGASRPEGLVPYDYQLGPGTLDVKGALQVMLDQAGSDPQPDVDASYYVLSSPYVRPDPTWPIFGTIELRHTDGTVASGVSGEQLTLHLDGADVLQPITRIRAGLYQFQFSAPRGTGGATVSVDVRYGGKSLGPARVLPVGVDAWAAGSGAQAVGGCSVAPSTPTPGNRHGRGLVVLLMAGMALGSRRALGRYTRSPRRWCRRTACRR